MCADVYWCVLMCTGVYWCALVCTGVYWCVLVSKKSCIQRSKRQPSYSHLERSNLGQRNVKVSKLQAVCTHFLAKAERPTPRSKQLPTFTCSKSFCLCSIPKSAKSYFYVFAYVMLCTWSATYKARSSPSKRCVRSIKGGYTKNPPPLDSRKPKQKNK